MEDQVKPGEDEDPSGKPVEQDRLAEPVDAEQPPRLPFPVVGIGASAGGLEAVSELLDAMKPDSGMAFILVQHLAPDRSSMMAEILARRTAMPVFQVEDGMDVAPNHVYVIRPGRTLAIHEGRLQLGPILGSPRAANRPIDDFFRSLAEEQRERAICVVMSGMGSNGTAGAQAIKAVGGLCIAQDPESALFPSMPRHLIDAGYADYILRPSDLPEILLSYARHPYARGGREADADESLHREQQHLREILAVLRTRTRQDFSGYKKPTLLRRIQRRMGLTRTLTIADYARLLRQNPAEVGALADDLLIHVTGFFRDPEAWETLRRLVIAPLVDGREHGSAIRGWVTACSSGEEAYSLAMILVEEAEKIGKAFDIKVFATDLAERSLAHARAGIYAGGIESEIPPERLQRFFAREDEIYRIRSELRDRVVFAPQNVLQDPPFSRLDIATCRNMLIYFEPEIQQRVLSLLHFGLREGGALFLGNTEAIAGAEGLFEPIDKKARIFRRVGPTRHGLIDFPLPHATPGREDDGTGALRVRPRRRDGEKASIAQLTRRTLLDSHTPAAVTVDRDHRILYYHGDTRPFLQQPSGEPTRDIMLLARDGIRGAARVALHRAAAQGAKVVATDGWVEIEPGRRVRIAVSASPILDEPAEESPGSADYFVVSFEERGDFPSPVLDEAARADGSLQELHRLRAELQSTIEELQTSNEELKASNEEVMSINEELQSANEELETSKEEMQSLNEELTTVNAQLRAKMEEHQATSSDLMSLLASTDIAVLFLDTGFRIRRYTPAVRDLLDLIPADIGRPMTALARRFEDPQLDDDAHAVLERLVPIEREVAGDRERHYLRRVLPYRTTDNRIEGVVVTFVDITFGKRAEEALRASDDRFRRMLNIDAVGVLMFDAAGTLLEANGAFLKMTGYSQAEVESRSLSWRSMTPPEFVAESERQMQSLAETGRIGPYEKELSRKDGSRLWMVFVGAALEDGTIVEYCIDATARKEAEASLRNREVWLRGQREALEAVLNGEPLGASLVALARVAVDAMGQGTRAAFYLAGEEGAPLRHAAGVPAARADAADGLETAPESLVWDLAARFGRPVLIGDVAREKSWEPWRALADRFEFRGFWSFPVHSSSGRLVGTLAIYSRQPRDATRSSRRS
ncbi:chemotaxis protein CheB [Aquisphaera insulae]|uniref:chemotaxis protein CheB n=1 Tax=Aquisphaera insulae TaxID=2712864 RepID=UPI00202FF144|nr:chemotaxis protein CheB [Aquisphaera insulae]